MGMGAYWGLFAFIILANLFVKQIWADSAVAKKKFMIVAGVATWIVMGLRSPQVGQDLASYTYGWDSVLLRSWASIYEDGLMNFETGFSMLMKSVQLISSDFQVFIAVSAAIFVYLIFNTIYKYSSNAFLSVIIFLCFGIFIVSFSAMRQGLAVAVTFYSIRYIIDKKPIKFVLAVLLASTFHKSAIIFILAWFARMFVMGPGLAVGISAVYMALVMPFLRVLTPIIVAFFFGEGYETYTQNKTGGAITMFIVYLVVFILSYFVKAPNDKLLSLLRNIALFATLFQSLGSISVGTMTRIGYYYSVFFCLFIPQIMKYFRQSERMIFTSLAVILFIFFFYLTTHSFGFGTVPYHFFFEPGYDHVTYTR